MKKFSPLLFLSSLGAGGLSVAFFAFINYTVPHGKGLITFAQTHDMLSGTWSTLLYVGFVETGMILFAVLHLLLTATLLPHLLRWLKTDAFGEVWNDPLRNATILAPVISLTMTFNVFLASIRYFVPILSDNLQSLMLPALIAWGIVWFVVLSIEIALLKTTFTKEFDVAKINFGWLLHPFALGMATVTGTGIAALAQDKGVADIAAFMSLVSGSMGIFLLVVKSISLFKSHFQAPGLPETQFLPSLLTVVPNVTLFAISFFRLGHYLENHYGAHIESFVTIGMVAALAFETWYLMFGISLLKDYFTTQFQSQFHVSQWALVCPFVAYTVLAAFVFKLFAPYPFFSALITMVLGGTTFLFFVLLRKQARCFFGTFVRGAHPVTCH